MHGYTAETRQQSKQWLSTVEISPKKAKTTFTLSVVKVKTLFFWNSQNEIYIDYLEKGKAAYLYQVTEPEKKRFHLVKKKVLSHHDKAQTYNSVAVATVKFVHIGYELLPQPPHSAPRLLLFPNLKNSLTG